MLTEEQAGHRTLFFSATGSESLAVAEDRRTLLKVLGGTIGGVTVAAVAGPAIQVVLAPIVLNPVKGIGDFVAVTGLASLPSDGAPITAPVVIAQPRDAWNKLPPTTVGAVFLRREGETVKAWSTICPHLGCGIDFNARESKFSCPCHESWFELDGSVSSGPAPRAMDELQTRIEGETVFVRFAKYALGSAGKVEV